MDSINPGKFRDEDEDSEDSIRKRILMNFILAKVFGNDKENLPEEVNQLKTELAKPKMIEPEAKLPSGDNRFRALREKMQQHNDTPEEVADVPET